MSDVARSAGEASASPTRRRIDRLRRFPNSCEAEVSRGGQCQPCDEVAVAVAVDDDGGHWWPVCKHHARGRHMLPLSELLEALSAGREADQVRL